MSKWDDDFDFDDDAPKNKKPQPEKKKAKDNDFFDDEDNNKLPSIGSKNAISKQLTQNKRPSAKPNPYAQNMKLRGNIYDNDQNFYQEIEDEPKIKTDKTTPANTKKKQSEQNIDYYQDIQEQPKKQPKKQNRPSKVEQSLLKKFGLEPKDEQQQEKYEEEVFDDAYGDDFEQVVDQPPKKIIPTVNTEPPQNKKTIVANNQNNDNQKKTPNQPPKPPSRASQPAKQQQSRRNMTVDKSSNNNNLVRSQSRQSMKSAESKRGGKQSRANSNKFSTNISFVPNKYTTEMEKSFPEVSLNEMNQDKINKLNEKLRAMIKKFNDELNQLINKNMLYLKSKKSEKSVNVETKLKILEEQSKNNETMIDVMQKQFDKLSGRDGELREEEYQLMTQKKIQEIKQLIKESQKAIVKLKTQIKSEGNKLTNKTQDKKMVAELHHLKTTLIQSKKDEEKQNQKIQKLDEQMQDLSEKITDVEYKLSQLLDQAKEKGIQLESKQELIKKFDLTKKKLEASKNHRVKLENLLKTKSDIISHEKEQMRINIKNCELQIKNLYDSISHVHNQSVKVVEKARTNTKLTPNLISDLDSILKSLELAPLDNYSVRSESNKSQNSNRPLKNSVIGNMDKSQPQKRSESANNNGKYSMTLQSEDNSKPNLLKKKVNQNQIHDDKKNQAQERIWRDEQKERLQQSAKVQQQTTKEKEKEKEKEKQKEKEKEKEKQKEAEKLLEQQKDKKKPFVLKKNRVSTENKANESKQQIQEQKNQPLKLQIEEKKNQEQKKEQVSLSGPRMMKFKRRNNQQKQKELPKQEEKPQKLVIEQKPIEQQTKNQEEKPSYVPKRFNLRNRQKKEDSYIPSVENKEKQEPKKQTKIQPTIEKKNEQYRPNKLNFGDDDKSTKKMAENPVETKGQQKTNPIQEKKQEDQSKPRFNLRLRDRKKNTEQVGGGGYMPSVNETKAVEQKQSYNLATKQTTSNTATIRQNKNQPVQQNINNPYASKQNGLNLAGAKKQEPKVNINKELNNPYAPKEQISIEKKQEEINNPTNPYIQNQGEGRKKEGPVKKPKVQPIGQKQKINIYEQAEQAEGLNEFVNQPKVEKKQPEQNYDPTASKDLNLNDLLGVKNKKNDDLADLVGGGNNTKKAKKNTDFFGDMDL